MAVACAARRKIDGSRTTRARARGVLPVEKPTPACPYRKRHAIELALLGDADTKRCPDEKPAALVAIRSAIPDWLRLALVYATVPSSREELHTLVRLKGQALRDTAYDQGPRPHNGVDDGTFVRVLCGDASVVFPAYVWACDATWTRVLERLQACFARPFEVHRVSRQRPSVADLELYRVSRNMRASARTHLALAASEGNGVAALALAGMEENVHSRRCLLHGIIDSIAGSNLSDLHASVVRTQAERMLEDDNGALDLLPYLATNQRYRADYEEDAAREGSTESHFLAGVACAMELPAGHDSTWIRFGHPARDRVVEWRALARPLTLGELADRLGGDFAGCACAFCPESTHGTGIVLPEDDLQPLAGCTIVVPECNERAIDAALHERATRAALGLAPGSY